MTEQELLEVARQAVLAADEDRAVEVAREAVALGLDPLKMINEGFTPGMRDVGDLFERGTMFLPEVIIASEAMVAAAAVLEESMPEEKREKQAGLIVFGTIGGDVHDIGKADSRTPQGADDPPHLWQTRPDNGRGRGDRGDRHQRGVEGGRGGLSVLRLAGRCQGRRA